MRVFAPTRHRHEAEISRHLGLSAAMTATGIEAVRGAQSLCHATLRAGADEQGSPPRPSAGSTPTNPSSASSRTSAASTATPTRRSCSAPTTATSASPSDARHRPADHHRGPGQPRQGRRRQRPAMPQHPPGPARDPRPDFPRPASALDRRNRAGHGEARHRDPQTADRRQVRRQSRRGRRGHLRRHRPPRPRGPLRRCWCTAAPARSGGWPAGSACRSAPSSRRTTCPPGTPTRTPSKWSSWRWPARSSRKLMAELARHRVPAVGLTGMDCRMLRARRKSAVRSVVDGRTVLVRNNHSGRITTVDTGAAPDPAARRLRPGGLAAGHRRARPGGQRRRRPGRGRAGRRPRRPRNCCCSPAHPAFSPTPTTPAACRAAS